MKSFTISTEETTQGIIVDFGKTLNNKLQKYIYDDKSMDLEYIIGFPIFPERAKNLIENISCLLFHPIKTDNLDDFFIGLIKKYEEITDQKL